MLNNDMIKQDNYPTLKLLCWSQQSEYISRRDAFSIYERNWRFVELDKLAVHENQLIDELKIEFGHGVLNA